MRSRRARSPSIWHSESAESPAGASASAGAQSVKSAIEGGAKYNGKPGVRAYYGANYYAAFVIDPDGKNIEAVCMQA